MELWDAYDSDFQLIQGKTLIRGESIPDGIYHLVCEVIVKHIDGTYLLMQRDESKHLGGYWEATAGGAALRGEKPIECAVRELNEETGISESELIEIGRIVHHEHHTIYVNYMVVTDCDKNSIKLQKGETQDYKWVDPDTLRTMNCTELSLKRIQIVPDELQ